MDHAERGPQSIHLNKTSSTYFLSQIQVIILGVTHFRLRKSPKTGSAAKLPPLSSHLAGRIAFKDFRSLILGQLRKSHNIIWATCTHSCLAGGRPGASQIRQLQPVAGAGQTLASLLMQLAEREMNQGGALLLVVSLILMGIICFGCV